MKQRVFLILISVVLLSFSSCNTRDVSGAVFDKCSVIATRNVTVHGDTVVTCDLSAVKESFVLPLSLLVDSLEVIRLECADNSLVSSFFRINISENYIGINTVNAYKLFTRQGKYVTDVGRKGDAPGEYRTLYDAQLSEENNRIYLLPWSTKKVLVYDLRGNYIEDIPLPYFVPKGVMNLCVKEEIASFIALPFENAGIPLTWTQDFKGNVLSVSYSSHLQVWPDYSNELITHKRDVGGRYNDFYLVTALPRADSLYHYDAELNRCIPTLTMKYEEDAPRHLLYELPTCYVIEMTSLSSYLCKVDYGIIIDKHSLRGGVFKVVIDQLGGIPYTGNIENCSTGDYFVYCMEPGKLRTLIETELSLKEKFTREERARLVAFSQSMSEDDNNYVLLGKWK